MTQNMKNYLNVDDEKMAKAFAIKTRYEQGSLSLEEAKKAMKEQVGSITSAEFAYMEQEMKEFEEDECQKEKIHDILILFEDILVNKEPDLPDDHPISCYRRENKALLSILLEIEDLIQYPVITEQWIELYGRLKDHRIHLSRKQNQLYPVLEQKGFDRPTTTMWTFDNAIRDEIQEALDLLKEGKNDAFIDYQDPLIADIRDLINKEESVLFPTSLAMISPEEFEEMKEGDQEIGFAWIEVKQKKYTDAQPRSSSGDTLTQDLIQLVAKHGLAQSSDAELDVSTGRLTLEQINLIFRHTPVDFSYVDEKDIVRFYSDTKHRIFPRSKNVIGRHVDNCHPRNSVHIVREIVDKFRSGEEDKAEFWINKPDLFIYITYVAVRDEEGRFRGVLEMMQDCTHIRSLEGSRTLLTWSDDGDQEIKNAGSSLDEEKAESTSPSIEALLPLSPDTRLTDLLAARPDLKDHLPTINSAFKMLHTPLARLMIPKATIAIMAERSHMDQKDLIAAIEEYISRQDS